MRHWLSKHRFEYYQAIYWLCYTGLTFTNNSFLAQPYRWWEVLITIGFVMAIVYSIVYVFMRYSRPYVKTVAVLVGMFVSYAALFYLIAYVWIRPLGERLLKGGEGMTVVAYLFTMFVHWYHSLVEAGLLAAIYRVKKVGRQKRELMRKSHRAEVQFLTAQMDPHEHSNLLNIPYAMAIAAGDDRLASVLQQVKQRMLYVPETAKDMRSEVTLEMELEQCDRITALNEKRFQHCFVQIDAPQETRSWQVPIFSVSALLQNAFKYGISWEERTPIRLWA